MKNANTHWINLERILFLWSPTCLIFSRANFDSWIRWRQFISNYYIARFDQNNRPLTKIARGLWSTYYYSTYSALNIFYFSQMQKIPFCRTSNICSISLQLFNSLICFSTKPQRVNWNVLTADLVQIYGDNSVHFQHFSRGKYAKWNRRICIFSFRMANNCVFN